MPWVVHTCLLLALESPLSNMNIWSEICAMPLNLSHCHFSSRQRYKSKRVGKEIIILISDTVTSYQKEKNTEPANSCILLEAVISKLLRSIAISVIKWVWPSEQLTTSGFLNFSLFLLPFRFLLL